MKHIISVFMIICCFPAIVSATDWGYSHNYLVKKKLNEKWSLESRSHFNSRDSMRDVFFGTADLGLGYQVNPWLNLGGAYRGAWLMTEAGWTYESRPLINLTLSKTINGYALSNRHRLEYRDFQSGEEDDIRYRNEMRIIFPIQLTRLKLSPYLEEEFFYSANSSSIDANWLTGGVQYAVNDHVKVKLGYRWLAQKLTEEWSYRNVLVTGLMLFF